MLCPMKLHRLSIFELNDGAEKEKICSCEQEKCAWWDSNDGMCVIQQLGNIEIRLSQIPKEK